MSKAEFELISSALEKGGIAVTAVIFLFLIFRLIQMHKEERKTDREEARVEREEMRKAHSDSIKVFTGQLEVNQVKLLEAYNNSTNAITKLEISLQAFKK